MVEKESILSSEGLEETTEEEEAVRAVKDLEKDDEEETKTEEEGVKEIFMEQTPRQKYRQATKQFDPKEPILRLVTPPHSKSPTFSLIQSPSNIPKTAPHQKSPQKDQPQTQEIAANKSPSPQPKKEPENQPMDLPIDQSAQQLATEEISNPAAQAAHFETNVDIVGTKRKLADIEEETKDVEEEEGFEEAEEEEEDLRKLRKKMMKPHKKNNQINPLDDLQLLPKQQWTLSLLL